MKNEMKFRSKKIKKAQAKITRDNRKGNFDKFSITIDIDCKEHLLELFHRLNIAPVNLKESAEGNEFPVPPYYGLLSNVMGLIYTEVKKL